MATQIALKNLNFANAASLPLSTTITAPDGSNPIAYGLINQMAKSKIEMETRALDFGTTNDVEKAQFIVPKNTIPAETNMSIFFAQSYPYGNRSVFDSYINVNAYIHNLISYANTYDFFSIKTGTAPTNLFYRIRQEVDPRTAYTGMTHVFAKINISDDPSNRFVKIIDTTEVIEETYISELIDNNYICLYNGLEGKLLQSFMAYSGEAGSRTQIRESERYYYNNPFIVLTSEKLAVAEVVNGAYTGNITEIAGDVKNCLHLFAPFMPSSTYYGSFSENPFGKLFKEDDIIKIICKTRINESGYRGYFTFVKRDALVRYMNYLGIPFVIDDDFNVVSPDLQKPVDELPDYDQSIEYVDPEGPPRGQPDDVTGGGDGNGDNTSDEYVSSNGYNPLYPTAKQWVMSGTEVDMLQSYLWFPSIWQQIQELWGDAWGAIISIKYYPFNILGHDASGVGERETIQIGNVVLNSATPGLPESLEPEPVTGAPMTPTYNCRIDLGEYEFKEYYGSFMDYEPYTSISIFLPFIGWRDIGTTEVMGNKLKVHYIIDFNTGGCTAYLTINNGTNEFLYSTYSGTIGIDLPLQQSDYMDKVRNMGISLISTGLGALVQQNGVSSSTSSLSQSSSNTTGKSDIITDSANKRIGGSAIVGSGRTISLNNTYNQSQSYINANRSSSNETLTKSDPTINVINGIAGVAHMGVTPVHTSTSGTLGPTDSLWLSRKPIIRIERPIKSEASSFEENQGRPSNITKKLADMTGYVECLNPVINFKCNESERAEIAALLQGGIYL